jgi:hypothetical protein
MDIPGLDDWRVRGLDVATVSGPSDRGRQGPHRRELLLDHRLAWSEIERFDSSYGYFGIAVVTKGGRVVRLNALQKSNLASWLNLRVRADTIASELNAQLPHAAA